MLRWCATTCCASRREPVHGRACGLAVPAPADRRGEGEGAVRDGRLLGSWWSWSTLSGKGRFAAAGRQRRLLAQWSRSWAAGRDAVPAARTATGGEGRDRDFCFLGKSRAVAMTLFAVKRHGDDTMLVLERQAPTRPMGGSCFAVPTAGRWRPCVSRGCCVSRPSWLGLTTTSRTG